MRKIISTLILLAAMNFGLYAAPGPNEVCVNNDWTYTLVNSAFQFLTAGDVIYFHEQTYDWTYASITKSCEIDGIADKSIAELNMTTLNINGTGPITVTIKDMIFRGGGEISIGYDDHVVFQNCTFENTAYNQVDASGGGASWSNVEFVDCTFNRTGSVGQNVRFYGDVSMDNCTINEVRFLQNNNDIAITNSHFIDSDFYTGTDANSDGRYNTNLLSNVHFENTEVDLSNGGELTYVEDVILEPFVDQLDHRIYGDTCLIYGLECSMASSFTVQGEDAAKHGLIVLEDIHFGILTDSYLRVTSPDSSYVRLNNVVVDTCLSSTFGFYMSARTGSDVLLENCSVAGAGTGFMMTDAYSSASLKNCHASNCATYGFRIKRGSLSHCSALDCGVGLYAWSIQGDIDVSNSIFANNTGDGLHFLDAGISTPAYDLVFVNNTIANNGGYGFHVDKGSGSSIKPTIFYASNISTGNTSDDLFFDPLIRDAYQYEIRNSLFSDNWAAYPDYEHMDCKWDVIGSYHDVFFDESADSKFDRFRPMANSVAIDNGMDIGWGPLDYSFDGSNFRTYGSSVDIGAHEFNDTLPHLILSTPTSFWEGAEDGQVIDVEIVNGKFNSTLNINNWKLLGYENGFVSLSGVNFIDSLHAEVTLAGSTPYLVWPLFRNQYNLGLQAYASELREVFDSVQGTGVLYLKAGEPIPDIREIERFHDQTNMKVTEEWSTVTLTTTSALDDNIVEFNIEVPATGVYGFEWRFNTPVSSGIDRIFQDDDLVMVDNVEGLGVGSWTTQTMDLHLTEGFHRMKFYFAVPDIEIEWFDFKGIITGSEELEESSVNVYPVPMKDELIIDSEHEVLSYELRGMNGNVLRSGTSSSINTESLVSGAYILKVVTPEGFVVKKVLK